MCACVCVNVCVPVCSVAQKRTNKLNETRRENHKQIIKSATRNRRTEAKAANITLSSVQHICTYMCTIHMPTYMHTYTHICKWSETKAFCQLTLPLAGNVKWFMVVFINKHVSWVASAARTVPAKEAQMVARQEEIPEATHTHKHTCIRTLGTFVQSSRVLLVGVMSGNMSKCNGTWHMFQMSFHSAIHKYPRRVSEMERGSDLYTSVLMYRYTCVRVWVAVANQMQLTMKELSNSHAAPSSSSVFVVMC